VAGNRLGDHAGVEGHAIDSVEVATFTDQGGPAPASDYLAGISWGDGTSSLGAIAGPDSNGVFTVTGSHTYRDDGQFSIIVSISHETAPLVKVSNTASITDAPLIATGVAVTGLEAKLLNTVAVAQFLDTGGPESPTLSHYAASIDWGDGTTSTGTIAGPDSNGTLTVTGSHIYDEQFTGTISVTITHGSAPPVTVTSLATIVDAPPVRHGWEHGYGLRGPAVHRQLGNLRGYRWAGSSRSVRLFGGHRLG
jgi:hypothetical protein